eukprot:11650260-Prorocentrum_lima.AAC.1
MMICVWVKSGKWTDCCGDEALVAAMRLGGSEESEGLVEAMKGRCKGDLHQRRGCMKCKKALGNMRIHKHGKGNSTSVLSADLSGPHPVAIGT